jgi:hypothetical protein
MGSCDDVWSQVVMCARSVPGLLIASLLLAAPASAQLEDAGRAYGDLNYEACRKAARAALEEPGVKSERVETYKLLGLCEAALGDTDAARSAFMKMLALKPDATLPPGLSPRFTSSFLEAKGEWVGKEPLGLELFGEKVEDGARIIRLIVRDEAGLVARVTWEDDDGERGPALVSAEKMELEVPPTLSLTLLALDEHDGVVATLPLGEAAEEEAAPTALAEPEPEPAAQASEEEEAGPPWLWIGVAASAGVLLAAGGAVAAGVFLAQPRDVTLQSEVAFGNQ